jgi:hypothetical protein
MNELRSMVILQIIKTLTSQLNPYLTIKFNKKKNFTQVLSHLQNETRLAVLNFEGIENWRQKLFELHVDDGSDDGYDLSLGSGLGLCRRQQEQRHNYELHIVILLNYKQCMYLT